MYGNDVNRLRMRTLRKIVVAEKVVGSECPPRGEKLTKSPKVRYK